MNRRADIHRTIERAQKVYLSFENPLRKSLSSLLENARKAVLRSRELYRNLGVSEICSRCDRDEGGSCCGAGIEDRYGEELLVANIMAGISLPSSRFDEKSCYFLGPEGCILFFRHTLCVNFLCKRLYESLGMQKIILIQNTVGEEIELTFRLCDAIYRITHGEIKP
jgi:hypothetical protein